MTSRIIFLVLLAWRMSPCSLQSCPDCEPMDGRHPNPGFGIPGCSWSHDDSRPEEWCFAPQYYSPFSERHAQADCNCTTRPVPCVDGYPGTYNDVCISDDQCRGTAYVCRNLDPPKGCTMICTAGLFGVLNNYDTVCTFNPEPGYLISGSQSMTCGPGQWSGVLPQVIPCECYPITPPRHGTLTNNGFGKTGDHIEFTCDNGYNLTGATSIYCIASNKTNVCSDWNTVPPKCEPLPCPQIPSPVHGSVTNEGQAVMGSTVQFSCKQGFNLVGNSLLMCEAAIGPDVQWSGSIPRCTSPQMTAEELLKLACIYGTGSACIVLVLYLESKAYPQSNVFHIAMFFVICCGLISKLLYLTFLWDADTNLFIIYLSTMILLIGTNGLIMTMIFCKELSTNTDLKQWLEQGINKTICSLVGVVAVFDLGAVHFLHSKLGHGTAFSAPISQECLRPFEWASLFKNIFGDVSSIIIQIVMMTRIPPDGLAIFATTASAFVLCFGIINGFISYRMSKEKEVKINNHQLTQNLLD